MKHNIPVQLFASSIEFSIEKIENITNGPFPSVKPRGGLWSSDFIKEKCSSDWIEYVKSIYPHLFIFNIREDSRILNLNSYRDLRKIYRKYKIDSKKELKKYAKLYKETLRKLGKYYPSLSRKVLDFEKIIKDFDAIYITFASIDASISKQINLNGYDCQSLLIINPAIIIPIKKIKQNII